MNPFEEKEKKLADLETKHLKALRDQEQMKLLPIETLRLMALRRAFIEYIEGEVNGSSNGNRKTKNNSSNN